MPDGKTPNDEVGLAQYRIDAGFVVGYVLAYIGILVFRWDPRYLFLGVALEVAMANAGLIVRAFMTARGAAPMLVATVLCLPALLVCLGLSSIPIYQIVTESDASNLGTGVMLLVGFLVSTIYSEWQSFRNITLPQARFTRYFDEKYMFENGEPVFNGVSHVLSSVVGSWLLTGVFVVSWFVAAGVGAIESGDGDLTMFNTFSAAVLLTLCLLRQLATIGILHYAYRNRSSQEELWLKTFSQAGKIVIR